MVTAQVQPSQPVGSRRRLIALIVLATLLPLMAIAILSAWNWLSAPERFPLAAVRLDGRLIKVTESELKQAMLPHLDKGLLGLDVERIRLAIEELPWVETATVRRRWPGTLVIGVVEREAVARWNDGLMSARGELFKPSSETFPESLPLLQGPAERARDVWARFQRLSVMLAPIELGIEVLRLDERQAWSAELSDGVMLELGVDDTDAAAERFVRAFSRLKEPEEARLVRIDLRYPNGFALAWVSAKTSSSGKSKQ